MSVDSYFCFCCLSTENLFSIIDQNQDLCCADSLKELFSISFSDDDLQDGYICKDCSRRLKEALEFKHLVFKTFNTLKLFGLITLNKVEGQIILQKNKTSAEREISIVDESKEIKIETNTSIKSTVKNADARITTQQMKDNQLENIQITKNCEVIKTFLSNDPLKNLEKVNNITLERDETMYNNVPEKDRDMREVAGDLKCRICMEYLPNSYAFNTHMNKHLPNYVCEECGKSYMTEKRLKRHKQCHSSGPFVCQECGVNFNKYSSYDSHRRRQHSSPRSFHCAHCPAQFPTLSQRERHGYDAHDVDPKYKCAQCAASFITSGLLNAHVKYKHLKLKRYFCEICGAGFFHKMELVGHTTVHSARSPYKCNLCNKSYLRKKALTVHLKLHKDDKRFCCDVCGKRFLQKCTLITHLKVHNRVKKKPEVDTGENEKENGKCEENLIQIEIEPLGVDIQSKVNLTAVK